MSGYTYAVARVRALENGLLSPGRWERLVAAETPEEAWRVLSETVYSRWLENRSFYQYEEVIWEELHTTAELLRALVEEGGSAQESFLLAYLLKYDMHNLKIRLLEKAGGRPGKPAPVSRYKGDQAAKIMADPRWAVRTGGQEGGGDPLARATIVLEQKEFSDPQELQLAVDRFYYEYMAEKSEKFPLALREFWALLVDLANLRILLRVKIMGKDRDYLARFLLPGGLVPEKEFLPALTWSPEEIRNWWFWRPAGKLAARLEDFSVLWRVEKAADQLLAGYLERIRRRAFGEEPLFAYFWEKEQEGRKLRVLLAAKINRIPAEEWKERI
ncbi:MAG: V-type ATPase subunit [Firmicutes bacterium]|nr:V-type ATPase subunit [Bacillota bacterium]